MSTVRTALVIGGGIAGPVTATALLKAGIEATVYEAYPAESNGIGGGLGLAPNGINALSIIGADEAVRAIGTPITGMAMSINGKSGGLMPSVEGVPPMQAVERGALQQALHDTAVAAGVPFVYNKRLVGVDEHADGVTARFTDGSTATADVLIGCDGTRSTVRTLIDPDAPSVDYTGMLGFGGYVDGTGIDIEPHTMVFAFGKRAYYLYWKEADGRIAWGANLPWKDYLATKEAQAIPAEHWLELLREAYAGDNPGEELMARQTPESLLVTGGLHIMPSVPHWYRGRMVLVGDAVHAPSNSTGQGASMAIESAIQLARCLRDLPDAKSAFAAYEQLRRPRVETIAARGAKTNRMKAPGPVAKVFMKALMPLMFRMMDIEKTLGAEQRYTIDWDAPVALQPTSA